VRKTITTPISLLEALAELFPDASRTTIRQMLEADRVRVNGEIERKASRKLKKDEAVEVGAKKLRSWLDPRLQVVFEDDALLVVSKASGLLTVASPGEKEETAQAFLNDYLKQKRESRVHVVHRIDRDTSGVLVFAKSFEVREHLKSQFAAHEIDRVYVAIISGRMLKPAGTMKSYLDEDSSIKVRVAANPAKGKLAVTHYKTIEEGPKYSMIEARLETGRKNQIRVHFADAGHPLIGDRLYGAGDDPIGRLGLHAMELGFIHPVTEKKLSFAVPLPDAFRRLKL
jgi:23S rRNA pseudouridine1911/1915/1917 synthase